MITDNGERSWAPGQPNESLRAQSQAIGIPLIQRPTATDDYEAGFKEVLLNQKQEGVTGGIFGDIDIEEHKQ